ncbi:MAG: tetratricopeptide repeat protein, partial [Thermoanaerobaculia bacterium]
MSRWVRLLVALIVLGSLSTIAQENPLELSMAGGRALVEGKLAEAERLFQEALALDAELPVVWLGLAEVRERQGRPQEALPLARRAQELAPGEAVVHRLVGRLLARLAADEAALEELARARQLAPTNPEPYLLSALLLRRDGKASEAVSMLQDALAAGAEASGVRRELVLLLLAEGRPQEAVTIAEDAVERYPGEAGLELGMGLALSALPERRREAPEWLEKALAGGVEQPARVRFELGTVLLESGQPEAARQHLEAASREMPQLPAVWYRLARARQADGDREGAAAAMDRFR